MMHSNVIVSNINIVHDVHGFKRLFGISRLVAQKNILMSFNVHISSYCNEFCVLISSPTSATEIGYRAPHKRTELFTGPDPRAVSEVSLGCEHSNTKKHTSAFQCVLLWTNFYNLMWRVVTSFDSRFVSTKTFVWIRFSFFSVLLRKTQIYYYYIYIVIYYINVFRTWNLQNTQICRVFENPVFPKFPGKNCQKRWVSSAQNPYLKCTSCI